MASIDGARSAMVDDARGAMVDGARGAMVDGARSAMAGGAPSVRIYLPAPALRSYVTFHYFVEADEPFSDFLYPGRANVHLAKRGDWWIRMSGCYPDHAQPAPLYGPTDRRGEIVTTGGKTVGFGMTPLGWDRLIGGDAGRLANQLRDLDDALGMPAEALRAALRDDDDAAGVARFDALLVALLAVRPPNDASPIAIDAALRHQPVDVPAFAAAAGVSMRTLHRAALRTFGFPPKQLLLRQRFLDTLGRIRVNAMAPSGRSSVPSLSTSRTSFVTRPTPRPRRSPRGHPSVPARPSTPDHGSRGRRTGHPSWRGRPRGPRRCGWRRP